MKTMEVEQQTYYTVSRLIRKGREKRLLWVEDKETFTSVEQAETYVRMRIGEDEGRFMITENKPLKMLVND